MATPANPVRIWASEDVPLASDPSKQNKVSPMDDLWEKGWDVGQKPACNHFNYVLNNITQWLSYINGNPDAVGAIPLHADSLTDTDNLNDFGTVDKQGRWHQSHSVNATAALHYPSQEAGTLDVLAFGTTICSQVYTTYLGEVYTRGQNGVGGWLPWRKCIVQLDLVASNLNNMEVGTVQFTDNNTLNAPTIDYYHVMCTQSVDGLLQVATRVITPSQFYRIKNNNTGVWSAWFEYATKDWVTDNFYPLHKASLSTENLNTLNNYSSIGNYFQSTTASATAANNYPIQEAGTLCVYLGVAIYQEYTTYDSHRKFARSYYSGAWQAWTEIGGLKDTASLGTNGWHKNAATGLITQWGFTPVQNQPVAVTFPIAFPTACTAVIPTSLVPDGKRSTGVVNGSVSLTGCHLVSGEGGTTNYENYAHYWIAMGY